MTYTSKYLKSLGIEFHDDLANLILDIFDLLVYQKVHHQISANISVGSVSDLAQLTALRGFLSSTVLLQAILKDRNYIDEKEEASEYIDLPIDQLSLDLSVIDFDEFNKALSDIDLEDDDKKYVFSRLMKWDERIKIAQDEKKVKESSSSLSKQKDALEEWWEGYLLEFLTGIYLVPNSCIIKSSGHLEKLKKYTDDEVKLILDNNAKIMTGYDGIGGKECEGVIVYNKDQIKKIATTDGWGPSDITEVAQFFIDLKVELVENWGHCQYYRGPEFSIVILQDNN